MRILFFTPIFLISFYGSNCFSQPRDNFIAFQSSCNVGSFCIDCGNPQANYPTDLTSYFLSRIDTEKVMSIAGLITYQIIVDSLGQACCKSIKNNTYNSDQEVLALNLQNIISGMTEWQWALREGRPENSSLLLNVWIHIQGRKDFEVEVQRIGQIIFDERKKKRRR